MAGTRSERVAAAVKAIQAFHAVGRGVPVAENHKSEYAAGTIAAYARSTGMNEDTLRKARQIANPVRGYTKDELKDLCNSIREHQTGQDSSKAVFTRTHVIRLLSVRPKRQRTYLQMLAIKNGWSTAELEAAIAERFGTRRAGGRRQRIGTSPETALAKIEVTCEKFCRLARQLQAGDKNVPADKMPAQLRKRLRTAAAAVGLLREGVEAELARKWKSRQCRLAVSADDTKR